ncbi:hypothetical protein F6464_13800 [Flavobacterium luteum]|uniref:Uncharacterized protein n=1 Tax=Flavobacterium luteum TaxID=2026654 RepID=A0A7J5A888_9FLAO|nr:hypothetical protein F6464_13800 [Flavobacterium luteum]
MFEKTIINFKKKSLKERFLLVIGILFFLLYLVLGLVIIFWKEFPINMKPSYRVAFGIVLIVYSFFRFMRFFNSNEE